MTTAEPTEKWLEILPANRADLLEIYRLERTCFPSPWPYQAFAAHLEAPAFLCAWIGGSLAGYLVADVARSGTGHIKDLAVAPEFRRRGIGSRLLRAGLLRLAASGADRVSLEVRIDNGPARALYREFGFTASSLETGYYEDGTDAVVMVRDLPGDRHRFGP